MKMGYVILYVPDVRAAVQFHEEAFGLKRRLLTDEGHYGELDAGGVVLSFAQEIFAAENAGIPVRGHRAEDPPSVEVAFVTEDVPAALARALKAGATLVLEPRQKPWGQTVAFVRDPQGVLVELCSPMEG